MKGTTVLDKYPLVFPTLGIYLFIKFIYLLPSVEECDFHGLVLFSFLFLQELIEVDSDVVFELASYILQVS